MQSESHFYSRSSQQIVEMIIFPMSIIGLNPMAKCGGRNYAQTIRVFVCNFILGYGMYSTLLFSYHSVGDFYSFVVPVSYFVCLLLVFVNVLWLYRRRVEIRYLLAQIQNNVYEYPDESVFRNIYAGWIAEKNYTKLGYLILALEIFGFIFAGTSPFVGYVFVGEMRTFIYPGWVSWTVDTPLKYVGTYCLQATVASTVFWVYYVTQMYITFVLVEFLRQYRKLDVALITLHDRTVDEMRTKCAGQTDYRGLADAFYFPTNAPRSFEASATVLYDKIYKKNLIFCIEHHRKILNLFEVFRNWYTLFYSMELTISVLSFSLLFYCLVEANDYERYSSIFGVTALLVSNVFTRCYVGERFTELNHNVSRSLFHCLNWYEQNSENRKLLVLLHLFTTRPLTLTGFGLFRASYYTFTSITRMSYSYFNLIRASL